MKHISLAEIDFSERVFEDVEFYLVYKESHFYENLVNYDNVGKIIKSVNSTLDSLKSSIPDFSNKIRAITQGLVAAQQNNIINEDRMQVIIDASQLNQNEIVNFVEQFIMHLNAIKHADNLLKESENMFDKHLDLSKEVKASTSYTICNILIRCLSFITLPIFTRIMNNFDDNESNDIYEYLDINRALKEKTNNEYDFIPQAGLFVKNSFYNENKEIVEQYLKQSVNKNLDEAINTPSKMISKLEELNISDEEFELKFGFKKDYILALQDNKENRFGIASSDNLITGFNFISEEKIDSFISLIS